MIQRAQKPFTFTDGREIVVQEANWDIAATRDQIRETALADKAKLNGSGDPELLYFHEVYYSYLASCSTGNVPDLHAAFGLAPVDLDGWYQVVMDVNPRWFTVTDQSIQEPIEFQDGLTLIIVSAYRPSAVMKRLHLELEAERADPGHLDVFAWYIYPRLAGCTEGDLPAASELRTQWPETEIYKWTDAARRINPHWFGSPQDAESRLQAETLTAEKKSARRPRKSSSSSRRSSKT
jgi:hypothetical protein